jgi:hypothetical protein
MPAQAGIPLCFRELLASGTPAFAGVTAFLWSGGTDSMTDINNSRHDEGSWLYSPKVRGLISQAIVVALLAWGLYVIVVNTQANLAKLNKSFGFDFLKQFKLRYGHSCWVLEHPAGCCVGNYRGDDAGVCCWRHAPVEKLDGGPGR